MSLTGQTSSTSSPSNIQSIINALAEYAKITGIDLSQQPFAVTLQQSNSSQAILQLFREREKAFEEYRDDNWRMISYLSPVVEILQAFSRILGQAVNLVSHICYLVSFFNVTSSGPRPTSKRFVCWDRCTACCTSFGCALWSAPL